MSWSFNVPMVSVTDFPEALLAARKAANIAQQNPDGEDQADMAVVAALAIVASGAVGGAGKRIVAQLSGHASPGHVGRPEHSGDSVSVYISQEWIL